jgi:hypothetical protein
MVYRPQTGVSESLSGDDEAKLRGYWERLSEGGTVAMPFEKAPWGAWHSLDLAVSRFSGRPGVPMDADAVTQEAYSQEVISFGFWAGDDNVGDAAYYSYTSPEPEGLRDQPLSAGEWIEFGSGSLAILPYETVRTARDPRQGLLAFCQSAYEAGARLAGWDTAGFESAWCPSPTQLQQLHASAAATFGRTKEKEGRPG